MPRNRRLELLSTGCRSRRPSAIPASLMSIPWCILGCSGRRFHRFRHSSCLARFGETKYTAIFAARRPARDAGCGRRMHYDPANPLIVQGDRTVLVEVDNPLYAEARDALAPFAELEKSPEHVHTYRISDLSLWNAAAAGLSADEVIDVLRRYTKFPLPSNL